MIVTNTPQAAILPLSSRRVVAVLTTSGFYYRMVAAIVSAASACRCHLCFSPGRVIHVPEP